MANAVHCQITKGNFPMIQQDNEVMLDCFKVLCCWLSKQHGSRLTIQEFPTPLDSFRVKQLA
jgi:hypothetical protein